MNLTFILAIVLIPVTTGAVIFFFVFRRVNRKYKSMFERLILLARAHPEQMKRLLAGSEDEKSAMIREMASLETIVKVDIVKAGRALTSLYIHGTTAKDSPETALYDVILQLDGQWSIKRFAPI